MNATENLVQSGDPHRGVQIWVDVREGVFQAEINHRTVTRRERSALIKLIDQSLVTQGVEVLVLDSYNEHFYATTVVRVEKGRFRTSTGVLLSQGAHVVVHTPEAEARLEFFTGELARIREEWANYIRSPERIRPADFQKHPKGE